MTRTSEGTFKLQYCTAFIAAANPFSGIVQEEFYDQYTEESITYLKKLFS